MHLSEMSTSSHVKSAKHSHLFFSLHNNFTNIDTEFVLLPFTHFNVDICTFSFKPATKKEIMHLLLPPSLSAYISIIVLYFMQSYCIFQNI